jgi:hypothetical protein
MKRIVPNFSRSQVRKAGRILKSDNSSQKDQEYADEVLTNWRGSHLYPINTFRSTLTQKLKSIDPNALVAQRLKRAPSIISKLKRHPNMNLALMQDIGGLRAVLKNINKVREVESNYLASNIQHKLVKHDDYISSPKSSGYRGIHLIYKYKNPIAPEYDGLFIEIQLRTKLQHSWATAVETIGAFINSSLKSSEGPDEWLNYFALTSSAFSILEKSTIHEDYQVFSESDIFEYLVSETKRLNVFDHFNGLRIAANEITTNRTGSHHLIVLDMDQSFN